MLWVKSFIRMVVSLLSVTRFPSVVRKVDVQQRGGRYRPKRACMRRVILKVDPSNKICTKIVWKYLRFQRPEMMVHCVHVSILRPCQPLLRCNDDHTYLSLLVRSMTSTRGVYRLPALADALSLPGTLPTVHAIESADEISATQHLSL